MADQRCPMCGKPNPAEAEVCKYCQARLKPLHINPSSSSPEPSNGKNAQRGVPSGSDSSLPDWLQDLKPGGEPDFSQESDSSLPDWMDDTSGEADESGGLPDWLSGSKNDLESVGPVQEEPAQAEENTSLPDWLSSIRKGDEIETGEESASTDSLGDYLATDLPPIESDSEELNSTEDSGSQQFDEWLSQAAEKSTDQPEEEAPSAPISWDEEENLSEDEAPDWLQRIRSRKEEDEQDQAPEDLIKPVPGEIPDWMAGIQPADESESSEETPDWLAGVSKEESEQGPDQVNDVPLSEEAAAPADDVPDWLKSIPSERGEERPVEGKQTQPDNWLQEIERSATFAPETEESSKEPAQPAEEVPDWLAKLNNQPGQKSEGSVPALIFDNDEDLGVFDQDVEKPMLEAPELGQEPDWISHVPADEAPPQKPAAQENLPDEALEAADLPGWLEAMRPVEAAAPNAPLDDETSTNVETSGPLQGMRGALPAQPAFGRLRKPPVQSLKLSITDNQKSHIALLEGLISNEDEPKAIPKPPAINSQALVRLIVAVILIAAVIIPMFLNQGMVARPTGENIPKEINSASMIVGSIGSGQPVLVAFDYDAGLATEVETASSALLTQLTAHNVAITAVSTNISGPVLAQRWMDNYNLDKQVTYENFYNLGYIPAGPAGLLAFAADPARVMPYDLQDSRPANIWNSGSLASVKSITDYKLIVVLTDNADSALAWIEQVQPLLREARVPLVIASSAQVEPILRPYYDNTPRQIDGLVAGMAGGIAYESLTGLPSKAGYTWDSMGMGVLVAAIIILVGCIISGTLTTISVIRKETREEEQ